VIFTSGHEHSLQIYRGGQPPSIVSGSGGQSRSYPIIERFVNSPRGEWASGTIRGLQRNGCLEVVFLGCPNYDQDLLFSSQVLPPDRNKIMTFDGEVFPKDKKHRSIHRRH